MIIETTIEINEPPSEVYEFLMDVESLPLWLSNFIKLERISGEEGTVGSISKHTYKERGRVIEMIEEIKAIEENRLFEGMLKSEKFDMLIRNELEPVGEEGTILKVTAEFTPKTLLNKILFLIAKKKTIKRHREDLQRLKDAVEKLGDYES